MLKQYEFKFEMVSGFSSLVQFQAVNEIRALHYKIVFVQFDSNYSV